MAKAAAVRAGPEATAAVGLEEEAKGEGMGAEATAVGTEGVTEVEARAVG